MIAETLRLTMKGLALKLLAPIAGMMRLLTGMTRLLTSKRLTEVGESTLLSVLVDSRVVLVMDLRESKTVLLNPIFQSGLVFGGMAEHPCSTGWTQLEDRLHSRIKGSHHSRHVLSTV